MPSVTEFLSKIFLLYLPLLFSLSFHEFSHAWMSRRLGDMTAFHRGRLSLNPIAHMDLMGTLFLPLFSLLMSLPVFGWAKPVPVDPSHLEQPKKDLFWIAFAGPLSNFLLSFIGSLILAGLFAIEKVKMGTVMEPLFYMTKMFIYINLLLGFFNLIPLHPLDGGKVLARFLPTRWNLFLETHQTYSSFLLIFLFVSGGFHFLSQPISGLTNSFIFFSHTLANFIV